MKNMLIHNAEYTYHSMSLADRLASFYWKISLKVTDINVKNLENDENKAINKIIAASLGDWELPVHQQFQQRAV